MLDLHPLSAERQGFEPRVPRSTTVFKTAAIDHSATSPNPERYSRFLCIFQKRRDRDSNPGYLAVQRFSRPPQSTTLPPLQSFATLYRSTFFQKRCKGTTYFQLYKLSRNFFLIRLQIFFLHLPLCKLRRRNIRQCKAVWYQTDKQFEKFSGTK